MNSLQLAELRFFQEKDGIFGYIGKERIVQLLPVVQQKPKEGEEPKPLTMRIVQVAPMPEAPKPGSNVHIWEPEKK